MIKYIVLLFTLLAFTSCSSVQMVKPKKKMILTMRDKRILFYQRLRQQQWSRIKKKRNQIVTIIPRPVNPIKKVNPQEQVIEIEQNLNYFCMERRKDSKFHIQGSCNQYTRNVHTACKKKYIKGDARLTTCVKSRLKN